MNSEAEQPSNVKPMLAGGSMLVALLLLLDLQRTIAPKTSVPSCQKVIHQEAVVSRQQLARLMTIPERDQRQRVQSLLKEPYCQLANLEIRAGVPAERKVYPLEFEPETWLVVLYEGNEYAGYQLTNR
ncbi:MAG: hypothetical protein SFW36_02630 [Leptolyngbyaceae cyanobacterium bins.59]|nr:hypothetical protein [Leptolyngbyaceae cyanobacterium bins.59]